MGAVSIDIYAQDSKYHNFSLSSDEDILEVLFIADVIKHDARKGNHEAIVLKIEFEKVFLRNDVCREYYKILNGYDDTYLPEQRMADKNKSILEIIAERLHMSKEECEDILHKSIKDMITENIEKWSDWANYRFKGKVIKKPTYHTLLKWEDESKFYQTDYNRKYVVCNHNYKEFNYPQDLQELVDAQKKTELLIEELQKKKKLTKEEKEQLRKRTNFNIELCKDISIYKQHYGIEIQNTNKKGQRENVSLEERDMETQDNFESVFDEWQIYKIKEIAKRVLTNKQLVIFNLRFSADMTQQEIANLLNDDQRNITNDLKRIIEKIKKNM